MRESFLIAPLQFFCLITFLFLLLTLLPPVLAAPGGLDTSFDFDGIVSSSFTQNNDDVQDIAIQPDGKIIAVGRIGFQTGIASSIGLARYNSDGSLDPSFGTYGIVTTSFDTPITHASAVALQTDGKIVVSGGATIDGSLFLIVVRYQTNGALDEIFAQQGKFKIKVGTGSSGNKVAVQPDGKIIVAGTSSSDFLLVRLNNDGSLDQGFGSNGIVLTSINSALDAASDVEIQRDGKIVAVGFSIGLSGPLPNSFALARYDSNGSLDTGFGNQGIVVTSFGDQSFAYDSAIQADGKIVAAGYYVEPGTNTTVFALARYNQDGSLDAGFDNDGKVTTTAGTSGGYVNAVSIQPDGKILAGGSGWESFNNQDSFLVRFNVDGSLDNSFGIGGKVRTRVSSQIDSIYTIALQSNGRIVVGGLTNDKSGTKSSFLLMRYLGDGSEQCTYTLSSNYQTFTAAGGSNAVGVTTQQGCNWTAATSASWITISNGTGSGNGAFNFSVEANPGPERTATITFNGQLFAVFQSSGCVFVINPASVNLPASGGGGSFTVTTNNPTCTWAANSTAPWITIASGSQGNDNKTVTFNVASNLGRARAGNIAVQNHVFQIFQASSVAPVTIVAIARVVTIDYKPIRGAIVTFTNTATGESQTGVSNQFGYLRFNYDIGQTFTSRIKHKKYQFLESRIYAGGTYVEVHLYPLP